MTRIDLGYGPMRDDEPDSVSELTAQALFFTAEDTRGWMRQLGLGQYRVVRAGRRVVAGLGIIPMGHWFGGRSVPAAGITAVGVAPEQRGSGIGLHVRGLAALYSGYMTPHELRAAGPLDGPDDDLAAATLAFAGPRPWTPDMF